MVWLLVHCLMGGLVYLFYYTPFRTAEDTRYNDRQCMKVVETVRAIDFNGPLDALRNNKVKAADTAFCLASHVTLAVE
jgi:hypothetical protein